MGVDAVQFETAGFTAQQYYAYDPLNRIRSATENIENPGQTIAFSWRQQFIYDRYGNRGFDEAMTTTLPKNCGTAPDLTVCAADRKLLDPSANTSDNRLSSADGYLFDGSGNTTTDAHGRIFIYDAENKQTEVRDPQNQTIGQYFYDGDGKRIKKYVPSSGETTVFVYDAAGKLVAAYSTNVAPVQDAKVAYLTNDHLGSPRINTDQDGNVTARHDYHPFGEEITGIGNRSTGSGYEADEVRKQFTGYERDNESDLDFAEARYYKPAHGRFTAVDPVFESIVLSIPQSMNRYTYVLNNPLLFIDPDGELWVKNEKPEYGRTDEYYWVDECGKVQTCYETLAVSGKYGVTVYGSNDFRDITKYAANKDGMIDVRELSQHHNAEFIVAGGQNVPEEFLSTSASSALFNVAKYYSEQYANDDKLVFTAGAASNGKPGNCGGKPCHSGHQGNDIDLRYMDSNGKPIQGDSAYQSADVGRTNFLIDVFKDNGRPVFYTGDDSRFGRPDDSPKYRDATEKVHRHHLHVGVSKPKKK